MFFSRTALPFFIFLASLVPAPAGAAAPTAVAAAPAKDASMPHPEPTATSSGFSLTYLSNGLAVAVKRDARFPLASLRLYVHAGSAYETPDQAGISHILEHMVFKGTEKRPKGAIATDIEKAGGYLNAGTSFDYTVYLTDMPSEHWELGLDVLKDMAFHPALDPEELEAEKQVILAELQRGEDSPSSRLFKRVQAAVLADTPYERPIIGTPETIMSCTVAGMRAYIDKLYQPQSMLLLVVGDVDPQAVLRQAEKTFGAIPNTGAVLPPGSLTPEKFSATGPTVFVEKTPWNKVHVSVAFPGVALGDARAPILDVFSQLLGGDTSSYLYQTYKYEKRLVDSISAANYAFERTGLFSITATLSPEHLAPFWSALTADLATLGAKTFTQQELDRAKLAVTDSLYRQKETVAGIASGLGYFLFFGGGETGEATYLQQIDLVDQGALTKAASAVLRPERLALTALIPENPLPAQTPAPENGNDKKAQPAPVAVPDAAALEKTLRAAWPVPAGVATTKEKAISGPEREIIELGQNRTLILQPDASLPYAAVDVFFTGGDSLLLPDTQGLASLTASVLTRGVRNMDATALAAFKNDRASSLEASSGRETFRISMNYPARFAPDMWRLLHDTLTTATLPDEEVSRAVQNQTAAIVSREDQPLGLAFRKLFPFLFGNHVYGYQSQGDRERLTAFTRNDVAAFWEKQSRRPWVLSVCGDFDRDAVIAAAKKLPAPAAMDQKVSTPAWNADKTLTIALPQRNQAHLLLVFPGTAAGSEDEPGLELLQNILAGQSGLLFRDLRDNQGLGYTVTAFRWQAPLSGAVILYIGTEPGKLEAAKSGFAKVIAALHAQLLPEEELVRGKSQMRGDYVRARQKMSARSAEAGALAVLGRPLDADKMLVDAAQKVTARDLQDLARKYLVMDKAYTVTVLPE